MNSLNDRREVETRSLGKQSRSADLPRWVRAHHPVGGLASHNHRHRHKYSPNWCRIRQLTPSRTPVPHHRMQQTVGQEGIASEGDCRWLLPGLLHKHVYKMHIIRRHHHWLSAISMEPDKIPSAPLRQVPALAPWRPSILWNQIRSSVGVQAMRQWRLVLSTQLQSHLVSQPGLFKLYHRLSATAQHLQYWET